MVTNGRSDRPLNCEAIEQLLTELENHQIKPSENTKNQLTEFQKLLKIFDEASIVVVTDKNGTIEQVNDTFCRISKYERHELIGRTHRIVKSGYHTSSFYRDMWKTISAGEVWTGEIKNSAKDGSTYWVKTTIYPICDDEGKPEKYVSVRTDITEGKEHEERMRELIESDYVTVIENLQNFVVKIKDQGSENYCLTLIEGRLAKEIELDPKYYQGKQVVDVFGEENEQLMFEQVQEAFNGETVNFDFELQGRYLHADFSPVFQDGTNKVIEVVGSVSDVTDLKRSELAVKRIAYHDMLTELPNRRKLEEDLTPQIIKAKKNSENIAVLLIDLDQFKNINDSLGHAAGDELIRGAASRIQQVGTETLTESASLYHLGGDEFLCLLYGVTKQEAKQCAENIIDAFDYPFSYRGGAFYQKASIGICMYPDAAAHSAELLKYVDLALLTAKESGRNTYRFFSSSMKDKLFSRFQIENDLRKALKSDTQFELYYQPINTTINGTLEGVEALVRWNHPERGVVSPLAFIDIAEETGLIVPLGQWVIRESCRQLRWWQGMGYTSLTMSVNISSRQFRHGSFVEDIQSILVEEGVSPKHFQLEITENGLMENTEEMINTLKRLREIGFRIAIDDFGTGYSSLSYLKKFPVTSLKIDKSFVFGLPNDLGDEAIVSSTIQLAHRLGLYVIAEGVESQDALVNLKQHDCTYVQGYYFSKPLPADQFTNEILSRRTKNED
ncbi:EAL domain-containing protein [Texcoconibacillus texcoconensis]|uniref:Diguanylate cyclase (GGDEF)-like protein/PAS domain S-box-containing protein n=1 Tax=Texcoconibacillus texcoconensis TaxID=1095777 RepID=A0A840QMT4_9BACI|nr:EAL domain-containing protein [Texcoconibacillus texcoconensis]MBB5172702.1 diguanylate cyclase (GGDEF)-like protein/PAS domain S-box-containing protein [Texcoconibacillus texcoconensis]